MRSWVEVLTPVYNAQLLAFAETSSLKEWFRRNTIVRDRSAALEAGTSFVRLSEKYGKMKCWPP